MSKKIKIIKTKDNVSKKKVRAFKNQTKEILMLLDGEISRTISLLTPIADATSSTERLGAWVFFKDLKTGLAFHEPFGVLNAKDKSERYEFNSNEKAERNEPLFYSDGHTNSAISREADKYPGCIIVKGRYLISISGYLPDGDTCAGLLLAEAMKWLKSAINKKALKLIAAPDYPQDSFVKRLAKRRSVAT